MSIEYTREYQYRLSLWRKGKWHEEHTQAQCPNMAGMLVVETTIVDVAGTVIVVVTEIWLGWMERQLQADDCCTRSYVEMSGYGTDVVFVCLLTTLLLEAQTAVVVVV